MEIMKVPEIAAFLGFSKEHTRRLLRAGKLPGTRVGRGWRVSRGELEGALTGVSPNCGKFGGKLIEFKEVMVEPDVFRYTVTVEVSAHTADATTFVRALRSIGVL